MFKEMLHINFARLFEEPYETRSTRREFAKRTDGLLEETRKRNDGHSPEQGQPGSAGGADRSIFQWRLVPKPGHAGREAASTGQALTRARRRG